MLAGFCRHCEAVINGYYLIVGAGAAYVKYMLFILWYVYIALQFTSLYIGHDIVTALLFIVTAAASDKWSWKQ